MLKVVGIGGFEITGKEDDVLKTFALGSCVGVTAYCAKRKVAAMAHVVMPESDKCSVKEPGEGFFADTAVSNMLDRMVKVYNCNITEIDIHLFGGAQPLYCEDIYKIGRKNIEEISRVLKTYNLDFDAEHTEGCCSRTVEIDVKTGTPKVNVHYIAI